MAFIHGKNTQVLHGAYDLSAYFNDASTAQDAEMADTTTFKTSGTAKTYIPGLTDGTVSLSGLFDGAANAVDEVLAASIGSNLLAPVTIGTAGFTIGNRVKIALSKTTSYEVSSPVSDVVSASYSGQADGGIDAGVSLAPNTTISASTNHASVDNAASTANGGIGQVHVNVNTRNVNTVVKIQHSSDNSTWVDLVTFATVATVVITSERVEVAAAATVNRYLRAISTLSAGTGAITYQATFARR